MDTRKSRDDSSERPGSPPGVVAYLAPCARVAFPFSNMGRSHLSTSPAVMPVNVLRPSSRSRTHLARAAAAKSKEPSAPAIDQNRATRPMFIEHPVHLLKRWRLAPIKDHGAEAFYTLRLRSACRPREEIRAIPVSSSAIYSRRSSRAITPTSAPCRSTTGSRLTPR